MSRGRPSRPARGEGDHPTCTNDEGMRKGGDTPRVRPKGRSGLDGWGPQAPFDKETTFQPQGCWTTHMTWNLGPETG